MYIDIHAHLTDKIYGGKVGEILSLAKSEKVELIVDSGYSISSCQKAFENANQFSQVFCTLGIHPEKPGELTETFKAELEKMLLNSKCIGVGEIGLDYHYLGYDKNLQKKAFLEQIELANRLKMPFVVHSRDASKDMADFLTANKSLINNGFLMHCYSESIEQSKTYLNLGGYFSFGGVLTFKNSKRDEVLKAIPIDRILAETDCPYLSPHPFRGQINYPSRVKLVYEKMAESLKIDVETLSNTISKNAVSLFPKLCRK